MSTKTPTCAGLKCNKPAEIPCTECKPDTLYCSELCRNTDFKRHKKHCTGFETSNCFLIRAKAPNGRANDNDHIEMFPLRHYGEWQDEMNEIQRRLGWKEVHEAGKFYSYEDEVMWYYYVYHSKDTNQPHNEIGSRCIGKTVYGDAAVIRSAPLDSNDYSETFTRGELLKTLDFYRDHIPQLVFDEREMKRLALRLAAFTRNEVN